MVDVVGSLKEVIRLALVVKEAADTTRHNKDACVELRNIVDILHSCVARLEHIDMSTNKAMRGAVTMLEGTLRQAHSLVRACQMERNFIYILFTARSRSRLLIKVKDDINAQIILVNFAVDVDILTSIKHQRLPQEGSGAMSNQTITGEPHSINYTDIHIEEGNDNAPMSSPLKIYHLFELEAATNNFSEENVIRKGRIATVYKGALPAQLVAIRTYSDQSGSQSIQKYIDVFHLLVGHENVVKFLGFCHVDGSEMVAEEYMPKGSLFEIITEPSQKLDWVSTFQVIRGVAHGLAYLHSKHVIHLDLNPANVLLDSNMNPKISNFEISEILDVNDAEAMSGELKGTLGYMSPEYITKGIISMTSDVFSFGVLLLHSISGMRSSILEQHPISWAWEVREAKGMNGLLDSSWGNEHQLEEMKRCMEIGLLCAQEYPKDRPTMSDVVKFLIGNEMLTTPKKPCFI